MTGEADAQAARDRLQVAGADYAAVVSAWRAAGLLLLSEGLARPLETDDPYRFVTPYLTTGMYSYSDPNGTHTGHVRLQVIATEQPSDAAVPQDPATADWRIPNGIFSVTIVRPQPVTKDWNFGASEYMTDKPERALVNHPAIIEEVIESIVVDPAFTDRLSRLALMSRCLTQQAWLGRRMLSTVAAVVGNSYNRRVELGRQLRVLAGAPGYSPEP